MTAPKKILIIGNGGAALHAVLALRGSGYGGEIHIASDVSGPAFNPMLSPYYLAGKISFEKCHPFGEAFYDTHRVICHFGSGVESLDPANRKCFLAGRREVDYDRCLIATGASPWMPPVPGLRDCARAVTLRTAEQTRHLGRILPTVRRVLILGASLAGVKLADTLSAVGIQVILADLAEHVLPFVSHPDCAAHIENHLRECGIELRLQSNLEGAEDFPSGIRLYFREQGPVDTDLCVVCTGIRPNMAFLEESRVKRGDGIHVDGQMQTSEPDLYAAGDVSQGVNLLSGEKEVIALWGNACNQGRTAGLNMAGRKSVYPGSIPQCVNTFFGMTFISMGDLRKRGDDVRISLCENAGRRCCRLLLFEKGILIGVNTVNCLQEIGYMKAAISQRLEGRASRGPGIGQPLWLRENAIPRSCAAGWGGLVPVSGLP